MNVFFNADILFSLYYAYNVDILFIQNSLYQPKMEMRYNITEIYAQLCAYIVSIENLKLVTKIF